MKFRWSKFVWRDWQNDLALKTCGLAARGLWVELLALMHDAEPHGHLAISGNPISNKQIAGLVNATVGEVVKLLAELEAANVFSRTDTGIIMSRRMVRDREKEDRARECGAMGGNPILKRPDSKADNGEDNGGGNGSDNQGVNLTVMSKTIDKRKKEREGKGTRPPPEPDPSAAPAGASPAPPSPCEPDAIDRLGKVVQRPRRAAASLMGKLLQTSGNRPAAVEQALATVEQNPKAEPVAWLMKAVKPPAPRAAGSDPKPGSVSANMRWMYDLRYPERDETEDIEVLQ